MSNAAKLKKRAAELEQRKQFDKALTLYVQFLQESDGTLDDIDVPLYNRVGDLMLRMGNVPDALNYYEKAVDLYAERGFHNNAIALCNKVLRQSPGRSSIYYKLGRISATKGFKSDAKKNFLEYADRMQKAGQIDEAFRALKEFADLCPDQDDIRLMLAEQLSKENRQSEALEQLQKLHEKLEQEGRGAEARATVDRMKSIDPDAVPRSSGAHRPQKSSDLIFLDVSYEDAAASRRGRPPRRQMSDPDLIAVTLSDQPAGVTPMEPMRGDGFTALDIAVTEARTDDESDEGVEAGTAAAEPVALIDLDDGLAAPPSTPTLDAPTAAPVSDDDAIIIAAIDSTRAEQPVESALGAAAFAGDAATDLAFEVDTPLDSSAADFFDFRSPPRSDEHAATPEPGISLDPDVAFPSLDSFDTDLPSADEVTSGASLAAALVSEGMLDLPSIEPSTPDKEPGGGDLPREQTSAAEPLFQPDAAALLEQATGLDAATASGAADGPDLSWLSPPGSLDGNVEPAGTAATPAASGDFDALIAEALSHAAAGDVHPPQRSTPADANVGARSTDVTAPSNDLMVLPVGELIEPDRADATRRSGRDVPAIDRELSEDDVREREPAASERRTPNAVTPGAPPDAVRTPAMTPRADPQAELEELRLRIEELPGNWGLRRRRAEVLFELGERAEGIRELEQVAFELEQRSDLDGAQTIVEELIRLSPESIRRHQKRVELAFRANDRPKLIDAYMDLGDALFRSGEQEKARAVYLRVLELAPDDPRCRSALSSVGYGSTPPASQPAAAQPPVAPREPDRAIANPVRSRGGDGRPGDGPLSGSRSTGRSNGSATTEDRGAGSHFVDLGEWLRADEGPRSTRMVTEEKPPTGDEQADFQEMLKRFKQGIAENVDEADFESHYDLGVAYKEMGLLDEAVAEFQKALRGTEHRVRAYEALGQCFVEKEQFQVAASVLSRAIGIGTDDHQLVGVLYLLGQATEALNNPGAALDYYQRVFAVDIEFRDVAERMRAIERKVT